MDDKQQAQGQGLKPPRVVIAGTQSGVGKTTLTAGLIAALRQRGLTVQPFKAGPDYIDPTYHTLAAGRTCRNLDTWMLSPEAVRAAFVRGCQGADMAIIEGVMGLYDGFGYEDELGSTAHLAKLLNAPVILVLDASHMARSAGAVALGFARLDPALRLVGFIVNQVASPTHGQGVANAVTRATGLPCLGWLPRAESLQVPERHLGLIPTTEPGRWHSFIAAAADWTSRHLDLDGLLHIAQDHAAPIEMPASFWEDIGPPSSGVRIAVARDEAFSFYYEDNLDLLRCAGAEVVPFSPLHDPDLPAGVDGLYIGGGFPELYAEGLAANASLRAFIRQRIAEGMPTYAECGGLMYLTEAITDLDGRTHPMVGALAGRSVMRGRLTMGYRLVTPCADTLLAPAGQVLRGHEFHYSEWVDRPAELPHAYLIAPCEGGEAHPEGFARGNLLASYVHLHFGARPEMAIRFVQACR